MGGTHVHMWGVELVGWEVHMCTCGGWSLWGGRYTCAHVGGRACGVGGTHAHMWGVELVGWEVHMRTCGGWSLWGGRYTCAHVGGGACGVGGTDLETLT